TYAYIDSMNCPTGSNLVPAGSRFIELYNGAVVNCTGTSIQGWDKAFYIPNIGSNPTGLLVSGTNITECNLFFDVQNIASYGSYIGQVPYGKDSIVAGSQFSIAGKDPRIV